MLHNNDKSLSDIANEFNAWGDPARPPFSTNG